ncbi:MAG TPA: SEC-C metal-binding domain-containing protein [Pyrinomonadaceae bacterium]|nr:SEC-C metal-binding domain-containing protein [Pyrinomonadaceae bacterium]
MKLGRNDPCHCGSGKKYKRCCLAKDRTANVIDYEWQKLRRTEGEIVHLLLHAAHDWHGPDFIEKAWEHYTESSSESLSIEEAPEAGTSFVPWALFNYIPQEESESDPTNEAPLAFSFLKVTDELYPYEKQFVLAVIEQPVSFWSVQEVDPGTSLKLRDLFTHTEHTVREQQASEILSKGDIVYTRVISVGQTTIMVGLAPLPFPPAFHFDILDARETLFGPRRKISNHDLQEFEPVLRQLYFTLRRRLMNPQLPILQNTDGDPLAFVKLTYQLTCSPRTAFDKLRSLNLLETEKALLADATKNKKGELQTVTFSWTKRGNKKHGSWDNTILGHITIEGEKLIVEVNSEKRSETIRTEIAKRLGNHAVLQDSVSESVEEKFAQIEDGVESPEQQQEREEQEAFSALPEVQALLKEMARKHWKKWLNEPVPVLMGKTPRQAAKSVAGRERLEALLIDFERRAAEMDKPAFAPDVTELRKQLGMLPGVENQKAARKRKRPVSENLEFDGTPLYQLKITLKGSDPPIWRRIVVRSDMPLNHFHVVIQGVMGWTDSHLHQFLAGDTYYGTPDPKMMGFGRQILSEKRYTIADLAPAAKRSFIYEYDFGDGWEHKIVVEKILPPDPEFRHSICLDGANACPPEDCGGIGGYYGLLEILADPRNPEHESMKEWLGYDLDPARFDVEIANGGLNRLKA